MRWVKGETTVFIIQAARHRRGYASIVSIVALLPLIGAVGAAVRAGARASAVFLLVLRRTTAAATSAQFTNDVISDGKDDQRDRAD